jgi:hypothetical protein
LYAFTVFLWNLPKLVRKKFFSILIHPSVKFGMGGRRRNEEHARRQHNASQHEGLLDARIVA